MLQIAGEHFKRSARLAGGGVGGPLGALGRGLQHMARDQLRGERAAVRQLHPARQLARQEAPLEALRAHRLPHSVSDCLTTLIAYFCLTALIAHKNWWHCYITSAQRPAKPPTYPL